MEILLGGSRLFLLITMEKAAIQLLSSSPRKLERFFVLEEMAGGHQ